MNGFWDERFGEPGYAYGVEPNAFLAGCRHLLRPGMSALAVADGEGRNGVWLAERGLEVLSVDASAVGLAKARALAAQRGVGLNTEQADLTVWEWPTERYDVVAAIFIHFPPESRARMHQAMFGALKAGGLLILEAFTPEQLRYKSGGPPVKEMLYTAAMLREDFPEGETLLLEEKLTELAEGAYHRGQAAVVRLILRRPQR